MSFLIVENSRKQALSKNLNTAHSGRRNPDSRFLKPLK